MSGGQRRERKAAWLIAFFLVAACSSTADQTAGTVLEEIPEEVWDGLYSEAKFPGGPPSVATLDLDAYVSEADPDLQDLLEHANARGVGELIESARLSYPDGVTATVGVATGSGGRLGLVVSDADRAEAGYFTTIDEDGVLEVSSPEFLVRFRPGGEMVEEWNAHSSCKVSHCVGAAIDFWLVDSWVMVPIEVGATYTCAECDSEGAFDDEACAACLIPIVATLVVLIPVAMAAIEECGFNDSCRWCSGDGCGTGWTDRYCTANLGSFPDVEDDWVLVDYVYEYYCSNPDEFSYCRTRSGGLSLVAGCPYGCDPHGLGGECAQPVPVCDPAECDMSIPLGAPSCTYRPDDDTWVVAQDYDEQHCAPEQPRGETCVPELVTRVLEECLLGCAADGRSCADSADLVVYQQASPDSFVRCGACRVHLEGIGGVFEGTTMIDGTVTLEGMPAGLYVVSGGCGPADLGPHRPSDLVLHPGVAVDWVLALGPQMDTSIELPNVVLPLDGPVDVHLRNCG